MPIGVYEYIPNDNDNPYQLDGLKIIHKDLYRKSNRQFIRLMKNGETSRNDYIILDYILSLVEGNFLSNMDEVRKYFIKTPLEILSL